MAQSVKYYFLNIHLHTLEHKHNSFIIGIQLDSQSFSDLELVTFFRIKKYSKMFRKYDSNKFSCVKMQSELTLNCIAFCY